MGEGGLEAVRSAHFGHSDCFTMVDIEGGEIKDVSVIDNPPHESGGCLRPMQGFAQAGIAVLFDAETPSVKDVALKAAAGELPVMGAEHACRH